MRRERSLLPVAVVACTSFVALESIGSAYVGEMRDSVAGARSRAAVHGATGVGDLAVLGGTSEYGSGV